MEEDSAESAPASHIGDGCAELDILEFFERRLRISMTRATVEDSTTDLDEALRTGRRPIEKLSFYDVSGMCTNYLTY